MNKKGFTLIELLAVILLLGIILSIGVTSYFGCLKKAREKSFTVSETNFKNAVATAYTQYALGRDNSLSSYFSQLDSNSVNINLGSVINSDYIAKIKNPYNTSEFCDTNSYVKVTRVIEADKFNEKMIYDVCLICGSHSSSSCE